MTHRLLMICALRPKRPVFPGGHAPDEPIAVLPRPTFTADRICCGHDPLTRRTAEALGLDAEPDPELAEIDLGSWRCRTLDDVAATDPAGFRCWATDPAAAPHGGESVVALLARIEGWLVELGRSSGRTIAIAPASVIKAGMLNALEAPATSYFRIDPEPLSSVILINDGRRWNLRVSPGRL